MWAIRAVSLNVLSPTATSIRLLEHVCSPGADVQVVVYRVWMLQVLAGPMGMLAPWLRDGEPTDAAFQVAATFPMKKMSVGVTQQGLPFDVQEFLAEIEKQNKGECAP